MSKKLLYIKVSYVLSHMFYIQFLVATLSQMNFTFFIWIAQTPARADYGLSVKKTDDESGPSPVTPFKRVQGKL